MSSTPYGISTSKGSMSYSSYVNTPIFGPLSTNQFPSTIPYHSYGTLTGLRPTPPQFYPSQEPVNYAMGANARYHYLRSLAVSKEAEKAQIALAKTKTTSSYNFSTGKRYVTSAHLNYIDPIPSSMYTSNVKALAVGKSSYKVGLPDAAPISTKSYYPSGNRTTIKRARSGGCVAPKKKGAIENYSLRNGAVCAWGALPRQNY